MKLPTIEPLPDVIEVLKLISNSEEWTKRLTALQQVHDAIAAQIAQAEKYNDIEQALADAGNKREQAVEYFRKAQHDAAELLAKADRAATTKLADLEKRLQDYDEREKALGKREADAVKWAADLEQREKAVSQLWNDAKKTMDEATRIAKDAMDVRAQYEAKLAKIHAAVQ